MTVISTLNATVAQIEDALRSGQSVEAVARDLQEPRNNVIAVWRHMQSTDTDRTATPRAPLQSVPAPSARPVTPVAGGSAEPPEPSLSYLLGLAAKSPSKRTQALGDRLSALATDLRARLSEERVVAERKAREIREREEAQAEFDRLQARMAELRPKIRISRGGKPGNAGGNRSPRTPAQIEASKKNAAKARAAQAAKRRGDAS